MSDPFQHPVDLLIRAWVLQEQPGPAELAGLQPDAIVVAAYGQILPKTVLEIPRFGCINVHPSLLPRHRGASPIVATILDGDEFAGVTVMLMTTKVRSIDLQAKLFRGFADPSRLSVLMALRAGPLTVSEIVEATGLSQSNASNHLGCLRDCGLVVAEQAGRFVTYHLSDDRVGEGDGRYIFVDRFVASFFARLCY